MIRITKAGKSAVTLENPIMNAAGIMGWGDSYRDVVDWAKLGAFVTNPVSLHYRSPANGTRVVPLDSGLLMHTGLPNPGLNDVIKSHRAAWERLKIPVILHLIATTPDDVYEAMRKMDQVDVIEAVELGLDDDLLPADAAKLIRAATDGAEKPVIVRLPFGSTLDYARLTVDNGASGLVLTAPPRGTARDAAGRLVPGRLYGPWVKPMVLRMVGQVARHVKAPVIASGGVHSPQDARDYIQAGAVAVQVDAAAWIMPALLTTIANDLGGLTVTQPSGALPDEWHEGMTDTERAAKAGELPTRDDKRRRKGG